MRALVTGCAGFIGSHLTESLLADGHGVIGVDCFNENYGRPEKLRNLGRARSWDDFDFVPVDLSRGQLEDLVAESDCVFHLAAEPGVRSSFGRRFDDYVRNNLVATRHLLSALQSTPQKRVVYASSSSVYGDAETLPTPEDATPAPYSPYGVTKLAAEHLVTLYHRNFGLDAVSLRLFSVYGPRQRPDMAFSRFCEALVGDGDIEIYGRGEQSRDFTFVADVVEALRAAATAPVEDHRVFNVGGGSSTTLIDALRTLEDVAGVRAKARLLAAEHGEVSDTSSDNGRISAVLGWRPVVRLRDGLQAQWEWSAREMDSRAHAAL